MNEYNPRAKRTNWKYKKEEKTIKNSSHIYFK